MSGSRRTDRWATMAAVSLSLLLTGVMTGPRSQVSAQELPSPYYMKDDVQYFPPGTEFKLAKEAAALKAAPAEQSAKREMSSPTPPQTGPYRCASSDSPVESQQARRGKLRRQDRQRRLSTCTAR